jgi:hypothetical protein
MVASREENDLSTVAGEGSPKALDDGVHQY